MIKHTLLLTQRCNLACSYCYIRKQDTTLSYETAEKIIDFIFHHTPEDEDINIGFFGGEPLLEFDLLKQITKKIIRHRSYDAEQTVFSVASNGTIFSEEIADFFDEHSIGLCISCDGAPSVQNKYRKFKNRRGSSATVEKNLLKALQWLPLIPVNAVYSADTIGSLPETIDYLTDLGVRNIHLNPNISSDWSGLDSKILAGIYEQIAQKYIDFYKQVEPRYISLIDSKIAVILRGGYTANEKCSMGKKEFAYAPSGNIYPCERLVEGDDGGVHCIGNVHNNSFHPVNCTGPTGEVQNAECRTCSVKSYCMNWCSCTNYFATGEYNRVNHFTCASEKAAIRAALHVIETAGENGISFSDHLSGSPLMSIIEEVSTVGTHRNCNATALAL